ncbi:MAG: hypothetical protein HQL17_08630, partial [Candidatus Omnitrophica bacterium]|nr:hypothetical protein [Candidatus Omnitrophota bacterium]
VASKINAKDGEYPSYDINGDKQEETIYGLRVFAAGVCPGQGPSYAASAMTPSAGDWNMEKQKEDYLDPNNAQGMRSDMRIYTEMQDASGNKTYLDIKDGKQGGTPVNISILRKAQTDIMERVMQLNNQMADPGDFLSRNPGIEASCSSNFSTTSEGHYMGAGEGCCNEGGNKAITCFDVTTKTLYIRSRISDKRGRKWVTGTGETFNQSIGGNP